MFPNAVAVAEVEVVDISIGRLAGKEREGRTHQQRGRGEIEVHPEEAKAESRRGRGGLSKTNRLGALEGGQGCFGSAWVGMQIRQPGGSDQGFQCSGSGALSPSLATQRSSCRSRKQADRNNQPLLSFPPTFSSVAPPPPHFPHPQSFMPSPLPSHPLPMPLPLPSPSQSPPPSCRPFSHSQS